MTTASPLELPMSQRDRGQAVNATRRPFRRRPALVIGEEGDSFRRLAIGQMNVDLRTFARQHPAQLTPNARMVHLVVPLAGSAVAVSPVDSRKIAHGQGLLLGQRQRTDFVWTAGSTSLTLHIPSTLLQQAVAASFKEPRRLAATNCVVMITAGDSALTSALVEIRNMVLTAASEPNADRRLSDTLVAALIEEQVEQLFPISRSVQRASQHLMAHPDSRCSAEDLAGIAGVTLPTLQRNVKTCLGMPLARFVEQVRLSWVHERLQCPTESRSILQLTTASGYRIPLTLTRAYQRHFGETPSQTRASAFAATRR